MAKLIIVVALCLVAVASAVSFQDAITRASNFKNTGFETAVAKMEEEAMTCPTVTCVASQADCLSTSTDRKYCPSGEFTNTTSVGTCNCRMASQFLALGATCYPSAVTTSQCGPYAFCGVLAGGAIADYKCYGTKRIGDSCTVGNECAAPRVCVSGKCVANLAADATCYNATTFKQLGMCPLNQYCPGVYTSNQVCTTLAAAGATCSSTIKCVPYTVCGILTPTAPTCDRYPLGVVATGSDVNNLGELGCVSYLANTTSGKCVDYDAELAKWNTAFPSPSTIACTTSSDCNLVGVRLASCACTATATGATPYCLLNQAPSVNQGLVTFIYKTGGLQETAFNAACENMTPNGAEFVNNAAYCSSAWSSAFLASICPVINFQASKEYQCYDDTLGICNGATALQSSVVMTMIVALVAFFTTQ